MIGAARFGLHLHTWIFITVIHTGDCSTVIHEHTHVQEETVCIADVWAKITTNPIIDYIIICYLFQQFVSKKLCLLKLSIVTLIGFVMSLFDTSWLMVWFPTKYSVTHSPLSTPCCPYLAYRGHKLGKNRNITWHDESKKDPRRNQSQWPRHSKLPKWVIYCSSQLSDLYTIGYNSIIRFCTWWEG